MSLQQIHEELLDRGIAALTNMVDGKPVRVRRVQCSACAAHTDVRFKGHAPAEQVIQNFADKGWDVSRRRPFCPSCAGRYRGMISHMPINDEMKEAIRGLHAQGFSYREIGRRLGISTTPIFLARKKSPPAPKPADPSPQVAQEPLQAQVPPEVECLRAEINALQALFEEQIADLRARLAPLEAMQ